ncbi:MAG: tryptophan synthase subunit beta like protein [Endozoicomonas sp. (ex Botrylloides leachii)]|nr:tryptophan synthase subunit beta like protein [Endozoicomonas sp. (ex Botrylloides leachii)]
MLYVLRDEQGNIQAVAEQAISSEWQSISLNDKALHAFLSKNPSIGSKIMEASDADFIRVLEDVIDILIDKEIIRFTEFPIPVQNKLLDRRRYREEIRKDKDTNHLLDDENNMLI